MPCLALIVTIHGRCQALRITIRDIYRIGEEAIWATIASCLVSLDVSVSRRMHRVLSITVPFG